MQNIEYRFLKLILYFTRLIPVKAVYGIMKLFTLSFYTLNRKRRRITQENLKKAFPHLDERTIIELSKDTYIELSKTVAEILLMFNNRLNTENIIVNKTEILQELQNLQERYKPGWIFLTAHFSNWELLATFMAQNGYPMLAVGREGDNKLIDKNIIVPFRTKHGNSYTYRNKAAVSIYKTLKKGGNVGLLIDQKVKGGEAVKVKFFGETAYTTPLVATMKNKLDSPVISIFIARQSDGRYKIILHDDTIYRGSVEDLTQHYNNRIENIIKAYPSQWFWMHNRWKNKD
jgi:KDO2-lipid IV(A) lauroyltransferase